MEYELLEYDIVYFRYVHHLYILSGRGGKWKTWEKVWVEIEKNERWIEEWKKKKNEETKRQNEMMRDCCLTSSGKYNAYSGQEHVIVIEISTLLCNRPTR